MNGREALRALVTLRELAREQVARNDRANGFRHAEDTAALQAADAAIERHALLVAKAVLRQRIAREAEADGFSPHAAQVEARLQVKATPKDELRALAARLTREVV